MDSGEPSIEESQIYQAAEYAFPYHYIPEYKQRPFLSRHWKFAASYVAALDLIKMNLIASFDRRSDIPYRHIDVGCGDGALIHYLSKQPELQSIEFSGIDIDERAVKWAEILNPDKEFYSGMMSTINCKYDSATLIEVMEHIPPDDLPAFMTQVSKLLCPNGDLIITIPSVEKPVSKKHFQHFSFKTAIDAIEPYFCDIQINGFERRTTLIKLIDRFRYNGLFHIDSPRLNSFVIRQLATLYENQIGCGRLFITCTRKSTG